MNILEMRNITKRYGENTVLENVSLTIRAGEIHAMLGENGAGKSTLMNILFGMPVIHESNGFDGQVLIEGQPVNILTPQHAMSLGIGMVHQEFMLIPGFTVTENIKLNREIATPTLASRILGKSLERLESRVMQADARTALDRVGMSIDADALVAGLPVGYMQFIEIAREIDKKGIKLLVFDEPTAVLTESEAEQLISVMRSIAAEGIAIIFITHRLDEVMAATDRTTILRDGHLVTTMDTKDTSVTELADLMIGRAGENMVASPRTTPLAPFNAALTLHNFEVAMPGESARGVELTVNQGEILGIGGLAGQGKIGIPNGVMGVYPAWGSATLLGEPLPLNDAKGALHRGLAMVSEDRRGIGLLLDQSIEDNIAFSAMQVNHRFLKTFLPKLQKPLLSRMPWLALCALCVILLLTGLLGIAQYPMVYDRSVAVRAYQHAQKVAEQRLGANIAGLTEEVPSEESATGEETAVQPAVPAPAATAPPRDVEPLSERASDTLTSAEGRAVFLASAAPFFCISGLLLAALLFVYWAMQHHAMTQFDARSIRDYVQEMIQKLDIRCTDSKQIVGTLSGGNQQKVCIARALALNPKFLFISEPTRGIDIGAKRLVLETLLKLNREQGLTIVMTSSELAELRSICDRIAIVAEGKVIDIFPPDAANAEIGLAMSGISAVGGAQA